MTELRAVSADALGPPESYSLRIMQRMPLNRHEVRVSIRAAGVSFVDVLIAAGNYQLKPALPFIPGTEGAGTVEEVGSGVKNLNVGDKVIVVNFGGLFAEELVVDGGAVTRIPEGIPFDEAAIIQVSYSTAWHALVDRAGLQRGETLLVLGAGGATGFAAVQIGKYLGAKVIASASTASKRAIALDGGADVSVEASCEKWREAVTDAADGKKIDVVFDPVGGSATEPAFRLLGWKGRHLLIGFPGGIASLRTNLPLMKGASLVGVDIRQFGIFEPDRAAANRARIFGLAASDLIRPRIHKRYPLRQFAEAMAEAARGEAAGRIVLTMDD